MKSVVIFLGPPGCGKGTQAARIKDKGCTVICAGDILRSNKEKQVNCNETIGSLMNSGKLLPDNIIAELVKEDLAKVIDGIVVLDGFPRTVAQAEMLSNLGVNVTHVINFEISDDTLVNRIVGRFACKQCGTIYNELSNNPKIDGICDICGCKEFVKRSDDNAETLSNRLQEYHNKTSMLLEYYSKQKILYNVDAAQHMDVVFNSIKKLLNI